MKYAVIDIETTGLNRFKDTINYIGVGLARGLGQPLSKTYIFNMYEDRDLTKFHRLMKKLRERRVKIIWQNGKFDTLFIEWKYKLNLPIHHDIMLMGTAYELVASHALDDMAQKYLGVETWDIPLSEKIKPNNPVTEKYLEKDLMYPWELFNFFVENMDEQQKKVYTGVLRPSYLMYRNTERTGIYFDQEQYKKVKQDYKKKEKETLQTLSKWGDINWRSPQQVQKLLFEDMGITPVKLSPKTGKPSADAGVLKRLASKGHQVAQDLLDYKFYYGASSKFLNTWGDFASTTGRIHPSFGITNVVTGRTSCSKPNLQQVPRNPELRMLFTAPEGRTLIEADYSQIEMRIAADYADETTLIGIYNDEGDVHMTTAGTLVANPTKDDRNKAKAVNFGFLYGMSAKGFVGYAFDSYDQVFSPAEARRYRELFFMKYPKLSTWHQDMAVLCELQGGVYTRFGQFRALPDIYSQSGYEKSGAIRRAINTPVQGTASVLLMLSAVQIEKELGKKYDLKIVGTIHDAVMVEVPDEYVEVACKEIQRIMANPSALEEFNIKFKIPLVADVETGAWGS